MGLGAKIEIDKDKTDRKALENKAGEGQTKKKNICFKCLYSKVLYQHLYKLGCLLPKWTTEWTDWTVSGLNTCEH